MILEDDQQQAFIKQRVYGYKKRGDSDFDNLVSRTWTSKRSNANTRSQMMFIFLCVVTWYLQSVHLR